MFILCSIFDDIKMYLTMSYLYQAMHEKMRVFKERFIFVRETTFWLAERANLSREYLCQILDDVGKRKFCKLGKVRC